MIKPGTKLIRYPWDDWLLHKAGSRVVLRHGRDFTCQTYTMTVQIRHAASLRDVKVSLSVCDMSRKDNGRECSEITITIKGRSTRNARSGK